MTTYTIKSEDNLLMSNTPSGSAEAKKIYFELKDGIKLMEEDLKKGELDFPNVIAKGNSKKIKKEAKRISNLRQEIQYKKFVMGCTAYARLLENASMDKFYNEILTIAVEARMYDGM